MRGIRSAWLPLTVLALTGCQPDEPPGADDDAEPPEPVAESADGGASEEMRPAGPDAGSAQETAREYMARTRGAERPAETGATAAIPACVTCHGADGRGDLATATPQIGGLEEWYLARQLKYLKQGIRGHAEGDAYGRYMHGVAMLLESNAQIEALAAHFADLDPPPVPATVDGDVERGREIYAFCAPCHGEDGLASAELDTPSLIGQSGPYMVRQIENYRNGRRGSHPDDLFGKQMAPIVESSIASPEDAVDVVAYIKSLENAETGDGAAPAEAEAGDDDGVAAAGAE